MSLIHTEAVISHEIGASFAGIHPAISMTRLWEVFWHLLETRGRGRMSYEVFIGREGKPQGDRYIIDALRMSEYFEDPSIKLVMIDMEPKNPDDFSLSFTRKHSDDCSRWGVTARGANHVLPGLLAREIVKEADFSYGVIRNGLYSKWQSCSRPDAYERHYGSIEGFRSIANMPPPLDSIQSLDISLNPGSGRTYSGESFVVAAEMWLGLHFWKYTKCTKEEVLAADFFIERLDTPNFLYLKCWPEPFTRPDGEQGRMQQRLWKLLFHEDCEWPPGSGTICDQPLYGPPELMPGYLPTV